MSRQWLWIGILAPLAAWGQPGMMSTRRADIRGGGGDGKCTIEVEVDGVAEVEVRGDTGRLRTLEGRPAMWRRFVCNQPMPLNPAGFRFRGIDGRGRQELLRDPGRGGAALVRIEDPRSGGEGYTFDLEWRGAFGGPGQFEGGRGPLGRGPLGGGGGWRGNRGDTFTFRGDGRGFFNRREGRDMRVRDVNVSLGRDGRLVLEFEAQGFRRLTFAGEATNISRGMVTAELIAGANSRNTHGQATVHMDPGGRVERIEMRGRVDGDPFRLDWSAR